MAQRQEPRMKTKQKLGIHREVGVIEDNTAILRIIRH